MWPRNLIVPGLIWVMIWTCLRFPISWSLSAVCNTDWILITTLSVICDEVPSPDRCYFVANNIATVVLRSGWWFLGLSDGSWCDQAASPAAQEWGGQSLVTRKWNILIWNLGTKDSCHACPGCTCIVLCLGFSVAYKIYGHRYMYTFWLSA